LVAPVDDCIDEKEPESKKHDIDPRIIESRDPDIVEPMEPRITELVVAVIPDDSEAVFKHLVVLNMVTD
jgi:hypothetical protein